MTSRKYRPVLSESAISHILSLARKDISHPSSLEIISSLAPFEYKIRNDSVSPAYTLTPTMSLAEKTGFSSPKKYSPEKSIPELYNSWKVSDSASFTVQELTLIAQYRFENDLMSPEEEISFQNQFMNSLKNT